MSSDVDAQLVQHVLQRLKDVDASDKVRPDLARGNARGLTVLKNVVDFWCHLSESRRLTTQCVLPVPARHPRNTLDDTHQRRADLAARCSTYPTSKTAPAGKCTSRLLIHVIALTWYLLGSSSKRPGTASPLYGDSPGSPSTRTPPRRAPRAR